MRGLRLWPKPGTIEHDYAIVPGGEIDEATRLEILDHAAIAMKQDQWPAGPAFDIVQANTVDVDETSLRRIIALRLVGKSSIDDRGRSHQADRRDNGGGHRIFCESTKGVAASDGERFFSMRM